MRRVRPWLVSAVLLTSAMALYLNRLAEPRDLTRDEVMFGLTGHSLATRGTDLFGHRWPFMFPTGNPDREMWFQPTELYAIAATLKVLPFSEIAMRGPLALLGAVNVVLIYWAAALIFSSELLGLAAAVLLAFSPAHFMWARVTGDFQLPVTYALGWLCALVAYVRRGRVAWLTAAGALLGLGLYSHIAGWMLMPLYAAATCVVLARRHEPRARYAAFAAGFLPLAIICITYVARHPQAIGGISSHYAFELGTNPQAPRATVPSTARLLEVAATFRSFFGLRLLFIDGPLGGGWAAGVFLVTMAGLLVVALARAIYRPSAVALVLVAACLVAAAPASALWEHEAIRRALTLVPFGVLLAVAGLQAIGSAESDFESRMLFCLLWAIPIMLILVYREHVLRAQAMIRAATVPLVVVGLAAVAGGAVFARDRWRDAVAAIAAIGVWHTISAYGSDSSTIVVSSAFVGALGAAALLPIGPPATRTPRVMIAALLAIVAYQFTSFYVNPAAVALLRHAPRLATPIAAVAAAAPLFAIRSLAPDHSVSARRTITMCAALAAVCVAYFHVDLFADPTLRLLQLIAVLTGSVWIATTLGAMGVTRQRLALLAGTAVLTIAALQFGYFYRDYFSDYPIRRAKWEGSVWLPWEALIDAAGSRPIPTIYLAQPGSYRTRAFYGGVYLVKRGRADLRSHVVTAPPRTPFATSQVEGLASGSLIMADVSAENDAIVDALDASQMLARRTLIHALDGTPSFWILERR